MSSLNQNRLVSLDVLRGLTVALMILVNSPGNDYPYSFLEHSSWDGCTLADFVFPFFIFILGISLSFPLRKAMDKRVPFSEIITKIGKRTLIIIGIGLLLNYFPRFDLETIRFCGVLQRIGVCYFFSALLFVSTSVRTQGFLAILFLVIYWGLMCLIPSFDLTKEGNLAAHIDRLLFSFNHLYGKVYDPEGLLSTLPAISTALLGNLTGIWLLSAKTPQVKLKGLFLAGCCCVLIGWLWAFVFPINKALWSSSYVFWTTGWALLMFSFCYWLIDIKGYKAWANPFLIFGMNAMLAYVLHVFFLKLQYIIVIEKADGSHEKLRLLLSEFLFGWASPQNAALFYALSYTLFWLVILFFYVRLPIFVKTANNRN